MKKELLNVLGLPLLNKSFFNLSENLIHKFAGGYILSFHEITPEQFEKQVKSLLPSEPIPLDELIERYKLNKSIKNCISLTFDDGVEQTVLENWKVCEKNNWPVTFYIPTDYLNGDNLPFQKINFLSKFLTDYDLPNHLKSNKSLLKKNYLINYLTKLIYYEQKEKIRDLINHFLNQIKIFDKSLKEKIMPKAIDKDKINIISKNQISSFQSHGVSHTACSALSNQDLAYEMKESKRILEDCTGRKVNGFCYPYGANVSINKASVEFATKYFDHATTLIKGRLKRCNPYFLPRIDLYQENTVPFTKLKIILSR